VEGVQKKNLHKFDHICVGFFLPTCPCPTLSLTCLVSSCPILIIPKNVCNIMVFVRVDLLGSLGLVRVDLLGL